MKRKLQIVLRTWHTFRAKKKIGGYGKQLYVNRRSKLTKQTVVGENVHFNGMEITGEGNVTIGNNFHSGKECVIITSFHNYEGERIPYDNTLMHRNVIIDDNVWIGTRVIILGGVTIGEGAIIQAGSVVVHSIPALAIAGGNPASVFKERDRAHYYALKKKGMFF